jgi:hypothetical protein
VALDNAANPFGSVMRSTLMAIRMSTLAPLLLFIGAAVFLVNFALLLKSRGCGCRREKSSTCESPKEAA